MLGNYRREAADVGQAIYMTQSTAACRAMYALSAVAISSINRAVC